MLQLNQENETYTGIEIKQTDVNLLSFPLKIVDNPKDILKDLKYYEPRLSPTGPAMGSAILSVLYSRMNKTEKAYELFIKSYNPNELEPFGVLAETAGGTNPYFATGAGGMLQSVLFGFGGLDINEKGITELKTQLPKKWNSLKISGIGVEKRTVHKN